MGDFRVEIRVRNGPLWRAIHTNHANVAQFCKAHGLSQSTVGDLLNLKASPFDKHWNWREAALKIADIIGEMPDDLWPEATRERFEQNKASLEMDAGQVEALIKQSDPALLLEDNELKEEVDKALSRIPTRMEKIIRERVWGEKKLEQVATEMGVSMQRIRQLEANGMRRLRAPERSGNLKEFWDTDNV